MFKVSYCNCKKKYKSITVSDAYIDAECIKDFYESVGKVAVDFGRKFADDSVKALDLDSIISKSLATRTPSEVLSINPDLVKFATTGEGLNVVQKVRGLYLSTTKIQRFVIDKVTSTLIRFCTVILMLLLMLYHIGLFCLKTN